MNLGFTLPAVINGGRVNFLNGFSRFPFDELRFLRYN
jgi:hypothetical protein